MRAWTISQPRYPSLRQAGPPGRHSRRRFKFWLACCCLCLVPACLAVPIPQGFRDIERAGKKVFPYQLDFVVPGQTTKAEFIEQVGQPYQVMDDLGVMAYYWRMLDAYVPWVAAGYPSFASGVGELQSEYLLLVSYNDQGVIDRYDIIRHRQIGKQVVPAKTIYAQAAAWSGRGTTSGGRSISLDVPAGQAVVYVFRRYHVWTDARPRKATDGVFLDGELWGELQAKQFLAIPVAPGSHTIGFERDMRTKEKFLQPGREAPAPELTTTIDARPNQAYFLEVFLVERDSRDFGKTPVFAALPESAAVPKLAGLEKAR